MARMSKSTKKLKQDYAFKLYCSNEHNRKEIAEKVDITEATLRSWIEEGEWDKFAVSLSMSKEAQIRNMMAQLKELNDMILSRPEGERFASTRESDIQAKTTKAIKDLETELGVSETVNVMRPFLIWARNEDREVANQIKNLSDRYIRHLINNG